MSYRHKHIYPKIKNLRKRRKFFQLPIFWVGFFILILIGTAFYFTLFFPKLQVSEINVKGNEILGSEEIKNAVLANLTGFLGIPTKSIFTFSKSKTAYNLGKSFPLIEKSEFKKKLPNTIEVSVIERKPFAVFCPLNNLDGCFIIDKNGIIFKKSQHNQDFTLVKDVGNSEVDLGERVMDENNVNIVAKIKNSLQNNFQIGISEVLVSDPLVVRTSENWKIYFDPTKDINLQILKMNSLLGGEITELERQNLQYIYLQYEDKTYYK